MCKRWTGVEWCSTSFSGTERIAGTSGGTLGGGGGTLVQFPAAISADQ